MNNRVFVFWGLFAFLFVSCDKNDDNYQPDVQVIEAFSGQYTGAQDVEWEQAGQYQKAEFRLNGIEMGAWYNNLGKWLMTESDLTFAALPEVVKTAFEASEYRVWRPDDVDRIERADRLMIVYVLEVDFGEQEKDLYYEEDGTFIKAVNGNNQPDHNPDEVI